MAGGEFFILNMALALKIELINNFGVRCCYLDGDGEDSSHVGGVGGDGDDGEQPPQAHDETAAGRPRVDVCSWRYQIQEYVASFSIIF